MLIYLFVSCTSIPDQPIPNNIAQVTPSPSQTFSTPSLTPTEAPPTATATITPSATPTNSKTPTASATFTPSLTPTLEAVCPDNSVPESINAFHNSSELQESILTYLNHGGKLTELMATLDNFTDPGILNHGVEADLNGDDVLGTIMTIDVLEASNEEDHSRILVLQCLGGEYKVVYANLGGLFRFLPHPITIVDLNGDLSFEFVIESEIRRSAWGWGLYIYSWQNGEVVDLFTNTGGERLGEGNEWELKDINGDGIDEVLITGYTIFHPDSGFPRGLIQTFELQDGKSYSLISTEYLPPEFRHHALEDAQKAYDTGDLVLAASFYNQAAQDNNLINIGSYHLGYHHNNSDSPNEYQRAFALFRLYSIQWLMDDTQGMAETLDTLHTKYPENTVGGEFTTLIHVLNNELESGKTNQEACQAVSNVII